MKRSVFVLAGVLLLLERGSSAQAQVVIDTVTVGNPGNAGELSGESATGGWGPDRICGAVDYVYDIGTFEITAGKYTVFLNAVAAEDTHGLYNTLMADPTQGPWGCNIQRSGSPGSYTYSVDPDWAGRPVNYVSWGDAARFANWMHNGQPAGAQDLTTTEDGSYHLAGAMSNVELMAIVRDADATWVVPSEDEWYKAAYHKNDGVTSNYWDYPTTSDGVPSNELIDPDPGNNANFYQSGFTIDSPYFRTKVGDFENSESPYGTFDQGGNVWEWNEEVISGSFRGVRGGSFFGNGVLDMLHAATRITDVVPTVEYYFVGFRVAGPAVGNCCDTDVNGTTDDVCIWCEFASGSCGEVAKIVPADLGGAFGACGIDGFCNVHDRNHALSCFGGTGACESINVDAGGAFGACAPDGFCNVHDANHALTCFAGTNTCVCGPSPEQPAEPHVVGSAPLRVAADVSSVLPGDLVTVRVMLDTEADSRQLSAVSRAMRVEPALQSYQLHLDVSGGRRGRLDLIDIAIEDRGDFVFDGSTGAFDAYNVNNGQMLAGLDTGSVRTVAPAYLATFTYRASPDAAGTFVVDVLYDEARGDQTFLVSSFNGRIDVKTTAPAVIAIVSNRAMGLP